MNRRAFLTGIVAVGSAVALPAVASAATPIIAGLDLGSDERTTIVFIHYLTGKRGGKSMVMQQVREYHVLRGHRVVDVDMRGQPLAGKKAEFVLIDDLFGHIRKS